MRHGALWVGEGAVGLKRQTGDFNRRLSQVRELFICAGVCTVKNRDVTLHVYNAHHHAWRLSYSITLV